MDEGRTRSDYLGVGTIGKQLEIRAETREKLEEKRTWFRRLIVIDQPYYLRQSTITSVPFPISFHPYPPINTANEIWLSINHSWRYEFGRWECSIPGHNFEFRSAYSVTGLKGRLNGELTRYIHGNSRGTRGIYFISKPRGRSNLNFQNFQFKSFFPMEF